MAGSHGVSRRVPTASFRLTALCRDLPCAAPVAFRLFSRRVVGLGMWDSALGGRPPSQRRGQSNQPRKHHVYESTDSVQKNTNSATSHRTGARRRRSPPGSRARTPFLIGTGTRPTPSSPSPPCHLRAGSSASQWFTWRFTTLSMQ